MDKNPTYLKTVVLSGFMCYEKYTQFEFVSGINSIMGANDNGKSTILSGILWVMTGKPPADMVKTWNDKIKKTFVELYFSDMMIGRYRENDKNYYQVDFGESIEKFDNSFCHQHGS